MSHKSQWTLHSVINNTSESIFFLVTDTLAPTVNAVQAPPTVRAKPHCSICKNPYEGAQKHYKLSKKSEIH